MQNLLSKLLLLLCSSSCLDHTNNLQHCGCATMQFYGNLRAVEEQFTVMVAISVHCVVVVPSSVAVAFKIAVLKLDSVNQRVHVISSFH